MASRPAEQTVIATDEYDYVIGILEEVLKTPIGSKSVETRHFYYTLREQDHLPRRVLVELVLYLLEEKERAFHRIHEHCQLSPEPIVVTPNGS
jgi:hypothetical protein